MEFDMKKLLLIPLLASGFFFGQNTQDAQALKKISTQILTQGEAYNDLHFLTKKIGNRLSGSPAYEKAVQWGAEQLKKAGAEKIWLQPVKVPVWERGTESLFIKTPSGTWTKMKMLSLGNSEGTQGKDLVGDLIMVNTLEEFNQLKESQVRDKIVFFNYIFRQDFIETFEGYSDAGKYRSSTASLVAKKGGKAVIVRSISTAVDDVPHTGGMHYHEGSKKIPAVALGPLGADRLAQLLKTSKVSAKLNSNCGMKGEKITHSVIGEIKGTLDQKVIAVGGHLDSWDVGEGAQDDGAGVVQSIEVIRTFKKLNIKPKHTIRAVLFANEENGNRGGETYADSLNVKKEPHLFALESDSGGYSPRGFGLAITAEQSAQVKSWLPLFEPYGIQHINDSYPGTDIIPMKKYGVALAGLVPDSQRYFDLHHSESDVFEAVNRRELLLGATVMTQLIYMIDQHW